MAAKKPVKAKAKIAKSVKTSKTTRSKTGRTAAQNKAYQTASKAAMQKAQLKVSTRALQERRLQAAVKVQGKLKAKGQQAFAARIKVLAVHRTYLQTVYGKQQASLRIQAANRLFKAQSLATNRQFAYLGEAIHARSTTLQTLTDAQAATVQMRLSAAARRAVLGGKSGKPKAAAKRKAATSRSPYASIGAAAGKAAAARVGKTAAKAPASKTRKASRLTPAVNAEWITAGNDEGEGNCIAVAIANHLYYHTGHRVLDRQVSAVVFTDFLTALHNMWIWHYWGPQVKLYDYRCVRPCDAEPGMIIGFEVVVDGKAEPHCGVLMHGNKVISWGEIVPLESEIEEAWSVQWITKTR